METLIVWGGVSLIIFLTIGLSYLAQKWKVDSMNKKIQYVWNGDEYSEYTREDKIELVNKIRQGANV